MDGGFPEVMDHFMLRLLGYYEMIECDDQVFVTVLLIANGREGMVCWDFGRCWDKFE